MECVIRDCTDDDGGDYSRLCSHHWCEQHDLSCDCSSCVLKHGLPSFYTNEPWLIEDKDGHIGFEVEEEKLRKIFGMNNEEYIEWVKQSRERSQKDD